MRRTLATAVAAIASATSVAVQVLAAVMLVVLAIQIFMRSVLDAPPSWSEEVALLAFSWAVLLAIAYGVREGIHVRMDLIVDALPAALQRLLERAVLATITAVGAFMAWAGWDYTVSSVGTTSAAIGYPMPWLYASTVVCGVLITVFALEHLLLRPADAQPAAEAAIAAQATAAATAPPVAPAGDPQVSR